MKNIHHAFFKSTLTFLALFSVLMAAAQSAQVIASGFNGIAGISRDDQGNLYVAEAGSGQNDGAVRMITPDHTVYHLVAGLPSYFDTMTHETSGPWKAYINGSLLQVLIGEGPSGGAASLFTFDLSFFTPGGPAMTPGDAIYVFPIGPFVTGAGFMETNPYRMVWDSNGDAVIVDAAANSVLRRKASDGSFSILHTFPPIPNTFTPFPPVIDYVPTAIAANPAGGYYLANLTGFPFLPNLAQVVKMDADGEVTPFATGLSQLVELQVEPSSGDLYALQFGQFDSTFSPVFNSAKIIRITPAGLQTTVAAGFGPSAGMVRDPQGGFYVTHLFTNQVLYLSPVSGVADRPDLNLSRLSAFPNPAAGESALTFSLREAADVGYSLHTPAGACLRSLALGRMAAGEHSFSVNLEGLPSGIYFVRLSSAQGAETVRIIKP